MGNGLLVSLEIGPVNDKLLLDSVCGILSAIKHTDFFTPETVIIATEITLDKYGLKGDGYTLAPLFRGFPASGTLSASVEWIKDHWHLASSFIDKAREEVKEQLNALMLVRPDLTFDLMDAEEADIMNKIVFEPNPLQLIISDLTVKMGEDL